MFEICNKSQKHTKTLYDSSKRRGKRRGILRVDLQSINRSGLADVQVQINGIRPPLSIAEVLIPTNKKIPSEHVRKGIRLSYDDRCKVTLRVKDLDD